MPDCPADWQPTPEQIAADQRRDVADAVTELGRAASVLSVPGMGWQPVKVPRSEKQKANNMLK